MSDNQITVEDDFMQYLIKTHPSVCVSEFRSYYSEIEAFCKKVNILRQPLFQTTDLKTIFKVQQTIEQNKIFRVTHKKQIKKIITAGHYYYTYIKEKAFPQAVEPEPHEETEKIQEFPSLPVPEAAVKAESAYTVHDEYLLQRYPVAYKLIFNALRNSPDSTYTINGLYKAINCFARPSLIKEILDQASWAKSVGDDYAFCVPRILQETSSTVKSDEDNHVSEIEQCKIYQIEFDKKIDITHSKPKGFTYFGEEQMFGKSWTDLYVAFMAVMCDNYPHILVPGTVFSDHRCYRVDLAKKSEQNLLICGKHIPRTDMMLETCLNSNAIAGKMRYVLQLCRVDFENVIITYKKDARTKPTVQRLDKIKVKTQNSVCEKPSVAATANKDTVEPQQMSALMNYIKTADGGVSLTDIRSAFPGAKPGAIKATLNAENIVLVNGKYYHKSNIEDFDESADIILAALQSQFRRNAGYTSAKMLYDELHVRLEDFFFDNGGFDSQIELYDLSKHLFEKIKYKGNSYIFAENKHIWESEPNYTRSYLGILSNIAKQHNGIMTRDEMIKKLEAMGCTSPMATFSYLMLNENQNPAEKTFLMYDEYKFVLTDACHIDDSFISSFKISLEELFEGDDYLAFDDIDDFFYTTLPPLPSGVIWSSHMIKSVLSFFDVGFFTVAVGGEKDIKVPDAAIVRKNSVYKSFGDILWSEINKDHELPKEFSADEFRRILLNKGFIHGHEKMYSVHTTVAGDLRYFWTDNNGKVMVSI